MDTSLEIGQTSNPLSSPQVSQRERTLLLLMIGLATVSALPLHGLTLSWMLPLLGLKGPLSPASKVAIYSLVTLGRVVILYAMGIAGLGWAKQTGFEPMPIANRVNLDAIGTGEIMAGIKAGLLCTLISLAMALSQVLVFGYQHPAGSAALARHEAARSRMESLISWRSAFYVCAGGPMQEEILFRLFLFSGLACALYVLMKRGNRTSSQAPFWSAIAVSGFAFGFFHVLAGQSVAWWRPVYQQLLLDPRTYIGIVLAWVYWKRGIETSLLAHITLNVVLFVPISALVWIAQPG